MTETLKLILQIVIEGATVIGLIIALAKTIIKAIKEKNWKPLLTLAMKLMAQAEESIENGSDRKKFVIDQIKASSEYANYDISDTDLDKLVEDLVELSKKVNIK